MNDGGSSHCTCQWMDENHPTQQLHRPSKAKRNNRTHTKYDEALLGVTLRIRRFSQASHMAGTSKSRAASRVSTHNCSSGRARHGTSVHRNMGETNSQAHTRGKLPLRDPFTPHAVLPTSKIQTHWRRCTHTYTHIVEYIPPIRPILQHFHWFPITSTKSTLNTPQPG